MTLEFSLSTNKQSLSWMMDEKKSFFESAQAFIRSHPKGEKTNQKKKFCRFYVPPFHTRQGFHISLRVKLIFHLLAVKRKKIRHWHQNRHTHKQRQKKVRHFLFSFATTKKETKEKHTVASNKRMYQQKKIPVVYVCPFQAQALALIYHSEKTLFCVEYFNPLRWTLVTMMLMLFYSTFLLCVINIFHFFFAFT